MQRVAWTFGVLGMAMAVASGAARAQTGAGLPAAAPKSAPQPARGARAAVPWARIAAVQAVSYAGLWALWPRAFGPRHYSAGRLGEAWTRPPYWDRRGTLFALDGDPWVINGVLHAVSGSEAYVAFRDEAYPPWVAFCGAVAASLVWEYGIEAGFQRPSAIDLLWTPFAGAVFGEVRVAVARLVAYRVDTPWVRATLLWLLDPLGQVACGLYRTGALPRRCARQKTAGRSDFRAVR